MEGKDGDSRGEKARREKRRKKGRSEGGHVVGRTGLCHLAVCLPAPVAIVRPPRGVGTGRVGLALRWRLSHSAFQRGTAPRKWVSPALSLSDQSSKVPVAK